MNKVNIHSLCLISTVLRGVTTRPKRLEARFFKIPRTGVVRGRYFPGRNALRTDGSFGNFLARRRQNAVFGGLPAAGAGRFLRWRAGSGRRWDGWGTAGAQTEAGAGWTGSCVRPAGHPALCFDRGPPGRHDVCRRPGDVHHVGDPADRQRLLDAIAVSRA